MRTMPYTVCHHLNSLFHPLSISGMPSALALLKALNISFSNLSPFLLRPDPSVYDTMAMRVADVMVSVGAFQCLEHFR